MTDGCEPPRGVSRYVATQPEWWRTVRTLDVAADGPDDGRGDRRVSQPDRVRAGAGRAGDDVVGRLRRDRDRLAFADRLALLPVGLELRPGAEIRVRLGAR